MEFAVIWARDFAESIQFSILRRPRAIPGDSGAQIMTFGLSAVVRPVVRPDVQPTCSKHPPPTVVEIGAISQGGLKV